jgi:hypothetical protein
MASADFCRLMLRHSRTPRLWLSQISPGKNADLHPMYLPHLPPCAPDSGGASFCLANSPAQNGLICGFCSSGQDFAAGFLQIPPHDGHPCLGLTLLAVKRVADLHRRVSAHAGRTNKCCPGINPEQHSKRYCQEAIQLARCRTPEHLSRCKGD